MAVLREDDDFEAIFNFNAPTANVPAVLMEGDEADQLTPPHQHRVEPPNTFEMPASSSWNSYHASAPVGRMEHNEDTLDVADLDTLDAASPGQVIPAELHQADQLIEAPFGGPFAVTFAGSPNFQVLIDDNKYISDNKHFYTRMMEKFAVKMTWNWNETKRPLFVRATMLFSDEKYSNEKVQCCTSHGAGPEEISQHFLRSACSDTPGVSYCGDVERPGSRLSVAVLFPAQPEPGQTYFSHTYQFHCMGTCASGVHNRPIQILFTLEDNGMVLDRQTVKATVHRTPCRPYNKAMRKLGLAEADSHGNKRRRIAEASAPERPLPNPLAADAGAGIYTLPVIEISGAGPFKHALDYIKMSLRAQQFGATDEETKELCRRGIRACEIAEREQLPKEEAPGWLTDKMESPRKFNDCYFYYYSTCTKGDNCVFRHEPSALGCETMCVQWQQGKCLDKRCKLRHMELRKNRKQIPCYWENQPGGCRKKHCPFQHKNPEARTDGIAPSQPIPATAKNTTGAPGAVEVEPVLTAAPAPHPQHVPPAGMVMPQLLWQQQPRQVVLDSAILGVLPASDMLGRRVPPAPHDPSAPYAALPVDPLVVSFEEESDNESVPSSTPTKMVSPDEGLKTGGKTQELILLEQIQAEAAAYYSYDDARPSTLEAIVPERRTVRTKLSSKYERLSLDELSGRPRAPDHKRNSLDFKILTLDEIRARKKRVSEPIQPSIEEPIYGKKRKLSTHDTMLAPNKVVKLVRSNSIVYRKVDTTGTVATGKSVPDDTESSRKRTFSIDSDVLIINDEELDEGLQALSTNLLGSKIRKFDNEPKGIQIKLIHTPSESEDSLCDTNISDSNVKDAVQCVNEANPIVASIIVVDDDTADSDLESEVIVRQPIVVSDEDSLLETDLSDKTSEVIEINAVVLNEEKLSKDSVIMKVLEDSSNDSGSPEIENSLKSSSVPDVVASCHEDRYKMRMGEKESEQVLMNEIDEILNEESL